MAPHFSFFEYRPLPTPTSIRLLTVRHPLAKSSPAICGVTLLNCRLVTVDLENKPTFNALSYTWGNPNPLDRRENTNEDPYGEHNKWPISVNGQLCFVTKNLYDALNQLKIDEWSEDAEVDTRCPPYNKTRLIQAAEEGRFDDVDDCLRHGANISNVDCFGETALHYAAENGHLDIVELLLENGADKDMRDSTNRTPLDCCLQRQRRLHVEVAKVLRKAADNGQAVATVSGPKVRHHRSKPIWIDAISVNQEDLTERNIQVAMMTRIYGQAQSVIIWLGAFDHTNVLDAHHQMPTILASSGECFKRSWEAWHRRKKTGQSDDDDPDVQDGTVLSSAKMEMVLEFVRKSYFHRVWVLQEVALARDVRIMFGGDDLPCTSGWIITQNS
ncbi:hypothetical protein NQ176_g10669 [Zarea fungicola]|uniref:Uncharacterized protein n=1 Tax=Zarea fungicola TaxID=93591 RepID=A0ACC1MEA2_9HYPO|nr:hypothetical protein NQ176_g10669 [Lecanicillium fungicola]